MRRISHFFDVLFGLLLLLSTSGGAAGHLAGRRGLRRVAPDGETPPVDHGFTEGTATSYQASMSDDFIPIGGVGSTEGAGMAEDAFNRTEGVAGLETETVGVPPSGDPVSVPGGAEGPTKPEPVPRKPAPLFRPTTPAAVGSRQGSVATRVPAQVLPPEPAALPQEIATEPVPAPVILVRMEGDQSQRLSPRPLPAQTPPPLPAPLTQGLPTHPSPQQELPSLPTERIFSGGIPPETAPLQEIPTESVSGGRGDIVGLPSELEGHPFASPPPSLPEPAVEERPKESAQNRNDLCDLYLGEDYVSNESGEGVSVASVADCCKRCQMGAGCVAFAFYTSGLCFLKHQMGQLMPNPLMTAGIMLRNGVKAAVHPVPEADRLAKGDWVTAPQQVAEGAEAHKGGGGGGGGWVLVALLLIVAAAGGGLVLRRFHNPRFFGRGWRPLQETEMGMLAGR